MRAPGPCAAADLWRFRDRLGSLAPEAGPWPRHHSAAEVLSPDSGGADSPDSAPGKGGAKKQKRGPQRHSPLQPQLPLLPFRQAQDRSEPWANAYRIFLGSRDWLPPFWPHHPRPWPQPGVLAWPSWARLWLWACEAGPGEVGLPPASLLTWCSGDQWVLSLSTPLSAFGGGTARAAALGPVDMVRPVLGTWAGRRSRRCRGSGPPEPGQGGLPDASAPHSCGSSCKSLPSAGLRVH